MTVRQRIVFWEVDAQVDFMLPGGKLYVPGAETRIPNVKRLVDTARDNSVFLIASSDSHAQDDPEFKIFPPHCVQGTAGAQIIPQGLLEKYLRIPNIPSVPLPQDLSRYQQVILEKQTLDVFDNPKTGELVRRLTEQRGMDVQFVVFGVVTEYCVRCAAKGLLESGQKVSIVQDAIEALDPVNGSRTIEEVRSLGARLVTTDEVLAQVGTDAARSTTP
jgi:nicotinamidase/pyrazinamidase